ncbi:MAG: sulfite exporter TauE/SafE family protein [Cryobacterium sp.]|nr:sulfite exporter TauE/SafE family protein [Cryobacterium sp.]
MTAILVGAIVVGAVTQRLSGMGFAMVLAPVLVLLLGPFEGVLLVNFLSVVNSGLMAVRSRRQIEWRTLGLLVVPAIVAIIPGSWLTTVLPAPVLQVIVGLLVIVAMTSSLMIARMPGDGLPRRRTAVVSGAVSGLFSTAAGVGGPVITAFAVLTRWSQAAFAATLQPYFTIVAAVSLITKLAFAGGGFPELHPLTWLALFVGMFAGQYLLGGIAVRFVDARLARGLVIAIAYIGGALAIILGAWGMRP